MAFCLCSCSRHSTVSPPQDQSIRIISLAPNLTEIVCAIGAGHLLVGRTSVCNYPPETVASIPVVGGFGTPSIETLTALKPTLILDIDLLDEAVGNKIDELGLHRERILCASLKDIPEAIRKIGRLSQHENEAGDLANTIMNRLTTLEPAAVPASGQLSVFVEVASDPLFTIGKSSFISELVRIAGGKNIGDEAAEQSYFQITPEWVIARDPDIIICLGPSGAIPAREAVIKRSGWENVNAVKTGHVYDNLNADVISRPGPRVLEAIEQLRAIIQNQP